MQAYQREFIQFALDQQVLKFGEFKLKSGRLSPYFFNTGLFSSGAALSRLGQFYSAAIRAHDLQFDLIYGPAYKGIPLGAAITISLARDHNVDVPYCFNRKEEKHHGEGGKTFGAPLEGRILIVDDVISAGISINESVEIINQQGAQTIAVLISLDRQERGLGLLSAAEEVNKRHNIDVYSIVKLEHVVTYLREKSGNEKVIDAISVYREEYGAKWNPLAVICSSKRNIFS